MARGYWVCIRGCVDPKVTCAPVHVGCESERWRIAAVKRATLNSVVIATTPPPPLVAATPMPDVLDCGRD